MSVVGIVDGQGASGLSGPEEKKKSDKKSSTSSKPVKPDKSVKSSSSRPTSSTTDQGKSIAPSTDSRFSDLDKKWSDRFNRLLPTQDSQISTKSGRIGSTD